MKRPMKVGSAVLTVLALSALAACSDAGTSPAAPHTVAAKGPLDATLVYTSATTGYVIVDPTVRQTIHFGDNTVTIPANTICDQNSGYGTGTWDQACTLATQPFRLDIGWGTTVDGNNVAAFSPDLRFAPTTSKNPNDWTILSLDNASHDAAQNYQIYWKDQQQGVYVDESATDPDLKSWVRGTLLVRRVKHFSGYVIGVNLTGSLSDPGSVDSGINIYAY